MMKDAPPGKRKDDYELEFEYRHLGDYMLRFGILPDIM